MSTTLTIRNLAAPVKQKLRMQAALHRRSMEAEARAILAAGVEPGKASASRPEDVITPQERMRKAIESVNGLWKGRMTTDELMELTRGDDIDDAYTRR
jgi:plasmid stability protein